MHLKKITLFLFLFFSLCSCKTKQFLNGAQKINLVPANKIFVVKNNFSCTIPIGIYPKYENIDEYVFGTKPAVYPIDSLICVEFARRNISCKTVENISEVNQDSYYIKYQDYWAWDFKKFMPVLKIWVYDLKNNILVMVASQANTAGMHDYPNPQKQVPLLVDLIMKNTE